MANNSIKSTRCNRNRKNYINVLHGIKTSSIRKYFEISKNHVYFYRSYVNLLSSFLFIFIVKKCHLPGKWTVYINCIGLALTSLFTVAHRVILPFNYVLYYFFVFFTNSNPCLYKYICGLVIKGKKYRSYARDWHRSIKDSLLFRAGAG